MEAIPGRTGFMSYLVNESLTGAQLILENKSITNIDANAIISIAPETTGAPAENYRFEISNKNIVRFKNSFAASVANGKTALLRAQVFGTPSPTGTATVKVTGLDSGLVGNITISVNTTVGGTGDGDGPDPDDDKGGQDNYQGGMPAKGGEI